MFFSTPYTGIQGWPHVYNDKHNSRCRWSKSKRCSENVEEKVGNGRSSARSPANVGDDG